MGLQKPNHPAPALASGVSAFSARRLKRRTSHKQKVWQYIRRNRTFRVGDLMVVLDLKKQFLKPLFWHLREAGYLKLIEEPKEYRDRIYRLVRDTGIKSPSIINGEVYDYNTKEFISFRSKKPLSPTRIVLLEAMIKPRMSKQEIYQIAKMSTTSGSAKKYMSEFSLKEIITKIVPVERRDGHILFTIDEEKRDELLRDSS